MVRWVILAVAVVGLTALATFTVAYLPDSESGALVPAATPKGPQPKVELDQPLVYEFGKMSQHSIGKHTWKVKNVGEAELQLWMEGKPTCSCTIAKLEHGQKAVVPPGESTDIELEWNTKDFERENYSQGATFGTNDPGRPLFHLTVAGTVARAVIVLPPQMIQFQTVSNEETQKARIAVFSPDRPGLKLTKLSTSRPDLIVAQAAPLSPEEAKPLKAEAGYRVTVEIKPGMPEGAFQEELVIQTDHPKQPEVRLALVGRMIGPISVVPEGLRIPDVSSLRGAQRELILLVRGDHQTHFEVAHAPAKFQVEIARDDTPTLKGRYRMTVTVPPGTPPGPIKDSIILKTDHPKAHEVRIPVNIRVSRTGAA
ncbi:MAG TPA: DUF1573 domain-containing protein [Isosphaeraceae bacterium]|nr:DUF1573 domain-containing protein [Isosphaeraceae bacterium]